MEMEKSEIVEMTKPEPEMVENMYNMLSTATKEYNILELDQLYFCK